MNYRRNNEKSYMQKVRKMGAQCYWRTYAIMILWICLSATIQLTYETLQPYIEKSFLFTVAYNVINGLLNLTLLVLATLTMTHMKLDIIYNRPLNLWHSIQQSVSLKLLSREAVLLGLWLTPYFSAAVLIFLPAMMRDNLNSFLLSISYLIGLITFIITPFVQIRWIFAKYAMIDKNCSPLQSIQKSKQITRYFTSWRTSGIVILTLIVSVFILSIPLVGMMVCVLMVPYYFVAGAAAYQIYLENNDEYAAK